MNFINSFDNTKYSPTDAAQVSLETYPFGQALITMYVSLVYMYVFTVQSYLRGQGYKESQYSFTIAHLSIARILQRRVNLNSTFISTSWFRKGRLDRCGTSRD